MNNNLNQVMCTEKEIIGKIQPKNTNKEVVNKK